MSYDRKRPISPYTIEEENNKGYGFTKLFNFLKPRSQQHKQQRQRQDQLPSRNQQNVSRIETDPLVNNFSSSRKRTLSIQSLHSNNAVVPRSSTLNSNFGSYTNYYDNLKNESEVLDNDLERRLSTDYGNDLVKESTLSTNRPEFQERDDSPMSDLMKPRPSILTGIDKKENQEDMPIIIEHEFAPLYKDNNGNLVRPPFINLDPRERYHVLQLKKSIQASEALQNRIKYMINPKETQSKPVHDTNKVDTCTQTHDVNYLESSLKFSNLKRKLLVKRERHKNKRAKNSKGYFTGEFLYDDIESNEKPKDKLHGYLGDVSKPKFNNNIDINKNDKSTSLQPRKDENQIFNRFSNQNVKSTDNRIGLDKSLLNNEKVNVKLDSDYVAKSEKVSDIIKLKTDSSNKSKEKESVQPSSGFKFSINSNDINSIINNKQENDESVNKSKGILNEEENGKKSSFSLGASMEKKDTIQPSFSFETGSKMNSISKPAISYDALNKLNESSKQTVKRGRASEEKEEAKPAFSFGKPTEKKNDPPKFMFDATTETANNDKSAISFGSSNEKTNALNNTKPTFSFAATPDKNEDGTSSNKNVEAPKPAFTFGAGTGKKDEAPKPAFTFGAGTEKKDETPKPAFTFGASTEKKDENPKPTFTFGASTEKKDETPKPTFTFGASTEKKDEASKPAFTFGPSKEKKDEAPKPVLAFGASTEKKDEAPKPPALTFGVSTEKNDGAPKPAFTFGASTEKKDETPKPTFTFGASTEKKDEAPKPALTFGVSTEKNDGAPKPAFTFGASTEKKDETPKPTFTFGASTEKKDEASKPAFTFGAPKVNETPKPAFTFGVNEKKETTPSFSFGEKPTGAVGVPSFGAVNQNKDSTPKPFEKPTAAFGSGSTTPNFSFGSRETTPKPNFSFATGTGANTIQPNAPQPNAPQPNNLFNFTGTVNKEGTPDPASIFGGGTNNMNTSNIQNGVNGLNKSAESSPFGFNAHQNATDFKFANGIQQPQFNSGLPTDMNNQSFNVSSMTPPTLSTTPPIIKSNRKIAQMRLRRR